MGAPVLVALDVRPNEGCDAATADGEGRVLAECRNRWRTPRWYTFAPDGERLHSFEAELPPFFFAAPQGFIGLTETFGGAPPPWRAVYVSAEGAQTKGAAVGNDEWPFVANRRYGGGFLTAGVHSEEHIPPAPPAFRLDLDLFDGMAANVSAPRLGIAGSFGIEVAVAEDSSGAVAFVKTRGRAQSLSLVWIDPATGTISDEVVLDIPGTDVGFTYQVLFDSPVVLVALAGGGVAIEVDGAARWIARPWQAKVEQAPAWLASHPGEQLRVVRQGQAQALVRSAPDSAVITLVSAAGEVCGTIAVSDFTFGDIGFDGTFLGSTGPAHATKVWWPGLLH
jgi:hypothetical protein